MVPHDETLTTILVTVDSVERELSPVSPELIARKTGFEVEEVKLYLAEARSKGWVFYFNSTEETSFPTAQGWTLTPKGQEIIHTSSPE